MKAFEIRATVYGTYEQEDPSGPSWWRGSGVYTIVVPYSIKVTCHVYAEDEETAMGLVDEYEFTSEANCPYLLDEITDVKIDSVEEVTEEADLSQTEEKVFSVDYLECAPLCYD